MNQPAKNSVLVLSYDNFQVRRRPDGFISVSDLWKVKGKPSSFRPDKWANSQENRQFLEEVANRPDSQTEVWTVAKGSLQGTFAVPEIAIRYAKDLDLSLGYWLQDSLDNEPTVLLKAKRRTIALGTVLLKVFRLATGEYRLSQTQVAEAVGKDEANVRDFLVSKSPEALPYKGFTPEKLPVEDERTRINAIPIEIAIAYWTKEADAHNPIAIRLLAASAKEAIERRADRAFGVHRTESQYNARFSAFDWLGVILPDYEQTADPLTGAKAMPLADPNMLKKLKRKYKNEVFSLRKQAFLDDLTLLGSQTDEWKLTREKGFPYPKGAANKNAYPDLISQPFECLVDGQVKKVVLLLQGVDGIVDENHVKDCVYLRDYIDLVKNELAVDHVVLFFVSPYGVTPYAALSIRENENLRGCIGVITVKQLANFLVEKAAENKGDSNLRIGKLKKTYAHLTSYKLLEELMGMEEAKKYAIESTTQPEQLELFLATEY